MIGFAISLFVLGIDYEYHRLTKPPPSRLGGANITIPRTDIGGPIPLVFGWTKVKAPFLVWEEGAHSFVVLDGDGNQIRRIYSDNMLFACGIPMGKGVTRGNRLAGPRLVGIWYGDQRLPCAGLPGPGLIVGQNVIREDMLGGPGAGGGLIGAYYWYGGWSDQRFDFPATPIGDRLNLFTQGTGLFSGLPNQMCVAFCYRVAPGDTYESITFGDSTSTYSTTVADSGFSFGETTNIQGISVEVQTYGDVVSGISQHIFSMSNPGVDFGGDADPMEVMYDVLTNDVFGKLGLPADLIDLDTWGVASNILKNERHGYSRAIEEAMPAMDLIRDIVRQVDGVFDIDITTGKLQFFLIRPDWDPATVLELNRTNTIRLDNVRITAATSVPNKVVVSYVKRPTGDETDYYTATVEAHSLANAVGQDGIVTLMSLHFEGVKTKDVALQIAERELAQTSRSLITMTAYVDGRFRYLHRGSVVKVTWSKPDIAGVYFRVADINRGTLADGTIRLELMQDAFYVYRGQPPQDTGFGGHDSGLDGIGFGG